ncbi:hypothetical protein D3C84_1306770 [compost metagenome]
MFDDKVLGDQTKLRSTFGEGWLKAIMGDNFDAAWDEMTKKWLAAGGQEVLVAGQDYYKKNK